MGASGNNLLQVIANNLDVLLLPLVTLVYPLHASIKAIETKSVADDQQWLTYWVLYSLITLFELTFAKVLEALAIWSYAKLILSCWLVLPHFNGAAHVYKHYIRPFYMNPQMPQIPQASQMWYFPRKKDLFGKPDIFGKPDDVLTAAERYMEEHGTEAFERLIHKADREARSRRNGNYMDIELTRFVFHAEDLRSILFASVGYWRKTYLDPSNFERELKLIVKESSRLD